MSSKRVGASPSRCVALALRRRIGLERLEIGCPLEHDPQIVEPDRLLVIIARAALDRADGALAATVTGEDDHFRLGRGLHDPVQRLEARLGAFRVGRQAEVEAHEPRLLALERREGLHAVPGKEKREVVPQPVFELDTDRLLVLDDEKLGLAQARPPSGTLTVTVVPTPSLLDTSMAPPWASTSPLAW